MNDLIGLVLYRPDFRIELKINVSKMSRAVGISRQACYNIIDYSSIPKVTTAIKVCKYLSDLAGREISVYDLWGNV